MAMRHGIVVQIEPDIGRLADRDLDAFEQGGWIVGQRQQAGRLLGERLADRLLRIFRTAPIGGLAVTPSLGLGIEVIEILEAAGGEE